MQRRMDQDFQKHQLQNLETLRKRLVLLYQVTVFCDVLSSVCDNLLFTMTGIYEQMGRKTLDNDKIIRPKPNAGTVIDIAPKAEEPKAKDPCCMRQIGMRFVRLGLVTDLSESTRTANDPNDKYLLTFCMLEQNALCKYFSFLFPYL